MNETTPTVRAPPLLPSRFSGKRGSRRLPEKGAGWGWGGWGVGSGGGGRDGTREGGPERQEGLEERILELKSPLQI